MFRSLRYMHDKQKKPQIATLNECTTFVIKADVCACCVVHGNSLQALDNSTKLLSTITTAIAARTQVRSLLTA
jgi:hypothetical protein